MPPPLFVVGLRMNIEHEVDETSLKSGARAREYREARTRDLRAPLEIQKSEGQAQVPMWLGLEVELRRGADHAHDFVLLDTSGGYLIEREIRGQQHQLPDSLLGATDFLIDLRNPCAHFPHLDDHLVGIATIALDPTDLFGDFVSPGLELIHFA